MPHIEVGASVVGGSREDDLHGTTNVVQGNASPADTNAATLLAAPGAGKKNYVRQLVVFPKALATAAINIYTIKTGSTTLFVGTVHSPATAPAAGTGDPVSIDFDPPIQGGTNEAITVTMGVASTAAFFCRGFVGR